MKMSVDQIYEATNALVAIANKPRKICAMAKYKLARMHDVLEPFHEALEKERIALIQQHGCEQFADPETKLVPTGWTVPPGTENWKLYDAKWTEVRQRTFEVTITPISLTMLGNDVAGLEMSEFKQLSNLVVDDTPTE